MPTSLLVYGGFGEVVTTEGTIVDNSCEATAAANGICIASKDALSW